MKKYYDAVIVGCGVAGCFAALHLPQEADILIDGVGSALVPVGAVCLLVRGQGVHTAVQTVQIPRLAVTDVLVQLLGLVLRCDTNGVDIGVDAVGQREVHDAVLTAEGHRRFCRLLCQRV
mgnify:CR=1 FL=1